jgi:acyl-coenzyme A synthetase/AMP-(fatty) acid ligase
VGITILDVDYRPVPQGGVGSLVISAADPGLFIGYYKDPERTSTAFRGGWFHTGDLATQDEDGYFFVAGRMDDCFKSRGIFISPAEVENALQGHPAVVESAVVPEPDPEIGNRIRAIVVLEEGHDPSSDLAEAIRESLRTRIAPFKVPHRIEFTQALPKSPVGKILRSELTKSKGRW